MEDILPGDPAIPGVDKNTAPVAEPTGVEVYPVPASISHDTYFDDGLRQQDKETPLMLAPPVVTIPKDYTTQSRHGSTQCKSKKTPREVHPKHEREEVCNHNASNFHIP